MNLSERLKKIDTTSSVSKEFRVYTVQGAVLSVATVSLILYLVASEFVFNFQVTLQERVHVNATNPRGVEMEFDISFYAVSCAELNVDAQDPTGQQQSLHIDKEHHVWKHRFVMEDNGNMRTLLGEKEKIELGSTLLSAGQLDSQKLIDESLQDDDEEDSDDGCGSCYGAGEDDECCFTCDDVKRAYTRKGWQMPDLSEIKQCKQQGAGTRAPKEDGEGCNVHGIVALDSGGGNLHVAPGEGMAKPVASANLLDLLLGSIHEWNVTHVIHKLRFGPEYPAGVYQLDGASRTVTDTHGMYQYYLQVSSLAGRRRRARFSFLTLFRCNRSSRRGIDSSMEPRW